MLVGHSQIIPNLVLFCFIKKWCHRDFPGGPVVKNPPCNTANAGSISGLGTKIPQALQQPKITMIINSNTESRRGC